jgi:choice-of-anchor B domain-containing protein
MRAVLAVFGAGILLARLDVSVAVGQQPAKADTGWTLDQPITGRALTCDKGWIRSLPCHNVELLSYLPPNAMAGGPDFSGYGSAGSFDLWGWTDSTTGREFALVGGSDATSFVEVTDPVNPKYLGKLPFHNGVQGLAGVKVYKNHAFIVVEGADAGMQIFDLTQLRDVKMQPATFQETAHYDNFGNAHTITMNPETGFAYPTGIAFGNEPCGSGLHMIDVRTPTKPTFAGCYTSPTEGTQYIHDAMCVLYRGPDQQYKGREICLNSSSRALVIVDVTDKKQVRSAR